MRVLDSESVVILTFLFEPSGEFIALRPPRPATPLLACIYITLGHLCGAAAEETLYVTPRGVVPPA